MYTFYFIWSRRINVISYLIFCFSFYFLIFFIFFSKFKSAKLTCRKCRIEFIFFCFSCYFFFSKFKSAKLTCRKWLNIKLKDIEVTSLWIITAPRGKILRRLYFGVFKRLESLDGYSLMVTNSFKSEQKITYFSVLRIGEISSGNLQRFFANSYEVFILFFQWHSS